MENIYELKRKRDQYYNLKDRLQLTVNNLNNTIDSLNSSDHRIDSCYTIDGAKADNNKLSSYKASLEGHKNKILYTVIPSIDREISNLRWKIQQAELELTES